jgi:ubiquinone/menaquinone biosynthesis C-methylase UbiE
VSTIELLEKDFLICRIVSRGVSWRAVFSRLVAVANVEIARRTWRGGDGDCEWSEPEHCNSDENKYEDEILFTGLREYLESGRQDAATMRRLLADSGYAFEPGHRVLEIGCAGGRMLRWLEDVAQRCEIWATDINGEQIVWCKQHLTPPFHFLLTGQYPCLPFGDEYFDVIYAGSLFTNMDDLADGWMLELRRVLKPGGPIYITIHDEHTIRILGEEQRYDLSKTLHCRRDYFQNGDYAMFTIGRSVRALAFYDSNYFVQRWKPFFDTVSMTPEAYGYQTGYVLRKL